MYQATFICHHYLFRLFVTSFHLFVLQGFSDFNKKTLALSHILMFPNLLCWLSYILLSVSTQKPSLYLFLAIQHVFIRIYLFIFVCCFLRDLWEAKCFYFVSHVFKCILMSTKNFASINWLSQSAWWDCIHCCWPIQHCCIWLPAALCNGLLHVKVLACTIALGAVFFCWFFALNKMLSRVSVYLSHNVYI